MASRDTIIDVTDTRTGHKTRIRVTYDQLQLALRSSPDDYLPNGRPVLSVKQARDHICIQAKTALAKKGRRQSYLPWADIEASVRSSDQVPARGSQPHTQRVSDLKAEPDYPPTLLNHQGQLFRLSGMLI